MIVVNSDLHSSEEMKMLDRSIIKAYKILENFWIDMLFKDFDLHFKV